MHLTWTWSCGFFTFLGKSRGARAIIKRRQLVLELLSLTLGRLMAAVDSSQPQIIKVELTD